MTQIKRKSHSQVLKTFNNNEPVTRISTDNADSRIFIFVRLTKRKTVYMVPAIHDELYI
jgi:hypothetical protein